MNLRIKSTLLSLALASSLFVLGGATEVHAAEEVDSPDAYARIRITPGDTLSELANQYGTTVNQFVAINSVADKNLIYVGEILIVPNSGGDTTKVVDEVSGNYDGYTDQGSNESNNQYSQDAGVGESNIPPQVEQSSAKDWIAQRESGGSYTAVNGQYIGKYQLNPGLFKSGENPWDPATQEIAADRYVYSRYGSWENAKLFWQNNGWY